MAPKLRRGFTILAQFWLRFSGTDFLMRFGRLLSPFWRPFAAPLAPLGSFWAPSGLSLAPFGSILAPFSGASGFILIPVRFSGCLLLPFWLQFSCFFFKFDLFHHFGSFSIPFLIAFPMRIQFLGYPTPQGTRSKIIRESQP